MWKDFKLFILRGNVLDLAVAVVIAGAFGAIVSSAVQDIIMPPVGLVLGGIDFSNLFVLLKDGPKTPGPYASLADAKAAGAVTVNYGVFLTTVVAFLIVALAVFIVVRIVSRFYAKPVVAPLNVKACKFCATDIPMAAARCPNCTSQLA